MSLGRAIAGAAAIATCTPAADAAPPTADAAPHRPNVILFLVDDLGQQDVSVPMLAVRSALNDRFRTPNVERLAARGMRFSDAYAAAPVCTPSRTAILSGQSPARTHITYWTLQKDTDTSSRQEHLDPPRWAVNGLQPSPELLPARLHAAGYFTIHAGKAHVGARGTEGADPRNMGYDVNIAGHAAGAPGSYLGTQHFMDAVRASGGTVTPADAKPSVWDVPGLGKWHGKDVWLDDVLAREACAAVEGAVHGHHPFFLAFCPYGVHAPIMADRRFAADYPGLDAAERAYATMVAADDEALGQLVACCERLGVLDDTVILFTSDNGGLSAHSRGAAPDGSRQDNHNAPLRSGKGSAYEGGIRVPFVAAGPGIPHRDAPQQTPIVGTDLYPTVLRLAGIAPAPGRPCDGQDLVPILHGDAAPFAADRAILFHQPHFWGVAAPGIEPFTAIRAGRWKLIWFHDGGRLELYDLAADVAEAHDLAAREPARVQALVAAMRDAFAASGAQLPTERATGRPVHTPWDTAP